MQKPHVEKFPLHPQLLWIWKYGFGFFLIFDSSLTFKFTIQQCLTHTHQLGIDMQLFIVSPLLVYLVWKWPKCGSSLLVALAAASTWLRYSVTYNNQLSSIIYFGNPWENQVWIFTPPTNSANFSRVQKMFETCNKSYILPTHRLTVYIMGILTGVYLRKNPNGINFNLVKIIENLWAVHILS